MSKIVYFVTYDLNIYTRPEVWDKEYKIYDKITGRFIETDKPKDFEINSVIVDVEVTRHLMKHVIHSNYGTLLPSNKMKWYLKFEDESKKRESLLNNYELLFNYLVLKANIAGINEDVAKIVFGSYISRIMEKAENVISRKNIINILDNLIEEKTFWVPDIENELEKECLILDDIINSRSTSSTYSFDMFEARYLKNCNEGYIKKIYDYNKDSNNLFSNGISLEKQKQFLINYFNETSALLVERISERYEYFKGNFASKKVLTDNMLRTLEYAMKFWT